MRSTRVDHGVSHRAGILALALLGATLLPATAQMMTNFDPPWEGPPSGGKIFTVPGIDNVPDLHGDIVDPQLVIFYGGNQYMVVPDLLKAFRAEHPAYARIFVETLPPGVLADQIAKGALITGNLRIDLKPDVYIAGKSRVEQMARQGQFAETLIYARNRLALMVRAGNPKRILTVADLGRSDVRVSTPNPAWEGIGRQVEALYRAAGGEALLETIMRRKLADGTTFLTQIHHRQTPLRIMAGSSDVGPVWYTEALYHKRIGHPIDLVDISDALNREGMSMAAVMKNAAHAQPARDFVAFLGSSAAQAIFRAYGFLPPR